MSAAFKLVPETEELSQKPPLGEKWSKPRLVWDNPKLTDRTQKGKSDVKPDWSYGRVLYNYFRYYDPSTGRYLTSDPIGLEGGFNSYAYALSSPSRYVDPLGLDVELIFGSSAWYGHTATRIGNTIYSSGRYRAAGDPQHSSFGLSGQNVLTVHSARNWAEQRAEKCECEVRGYELNVTEEQERAIESYYNKLIASGKKHTTIPYWYVLPENYSFANNNCTTLTSDGLTEGLPWYQDIFIYGTRAPGELEFGIRQAPNLIRGVNRY